MIHKHNHQHVKYITFSNDSIFLFGESTYDDRMRIDGNDTSIYDESFCDRASGGIA